MRFVRGTFTIVAVAGMSILAGGAWFGMLAAERDAESTATAGSRRAAAAAAVAISQAVSTGNRPEALIPLLEATGDTKVLVRDRDGTILGGSASPSKQSVTVLVPGTDWSVAVAVPRAQGLGLHRFVNVFAGISVLVLASALFAMYLLVRDRHRAAIALADANRRFRDLVAADELTGLGNQARLVDDVTGLLSRGTRYGNGFALIAFDVDGPMASEESVRAVAHVVQEQARGADRCYRLGARVVSLLPEQGVGGAAIAAERIRSAVADSGLGTVSAGVGAYVPWEDEFAEDVIGRAGLMARQSALDGGDRVTVAETGSHQHGFTDMGS